MFPEWFLNLPWNIFDTIINLLELLVVCIPATSIFIYYKLQTLSVWPKEITNSGTTLVIHNKSNKSIFIKDIQFINLEGNCFDKAAVMWKNDITAVLSSALTDLGINCLNTLTFLP